MAVPQEIYDEICLDVGAYPVDTVNGVSGIDFLNADNAVNSLVNRKSFPIAVPASGGDNRYSYFKYMKFGVSHVPTGYAFSDFKVWGPTTPVASGIKIYWGTTDSYSIPTVPTTASGYNRQDLNYYSEATALTISGELSAVGEYTNYLVMFAEVEPGAYIGGVDEFTFYYTFSGYQQTFLARFDISLIDDVSGDVGTFTPGMGLRNCTPDGTNKIGDALLATHEDSVQVNMGATPVSDAEHMGKALTISGENIYVSLEDDSFGIDDNLTLEASIMLSEIDREQTIMSVWKEADDNRSFRLYINSSNKLVFAVSETGTSGTVVEHTATITTLTTNRWYQISAKFVGSTSMDVYINGIADAFQKTVGIPASIYQPTGGGGGGEWGYDSTVYADSVQSWDKFGWAVTMFGDWLAVGNTWYFQQRGCVDLFKLTGDAWVWSQRIYASDPVLADFFGISLAMDADRLVVGAQAVDHGGETDGGALYVFKREGDVWSEEGKCIQPDPEYIENLGGYGVAIDGTKCVGGAPKYGTDQGRAHVFTISGGSWVHLTTLYGDDVNPSDWFGYDVGIKGDHVVVSAYLNDNGGGSQAGAAYCYLLSGSSASQYQKITTTSFSFDKMGASVDLYADDYLILGAEDAAIHFFTRVDSTWSLAQRLEGLEITGSQYGCIQRSGDYIAVGEQATQKVSILELSEGLWSENFWAVTTDYGTSGKGGISVGISVGDGGEWACVGVPEEDTAALNAGAVHILTMSGGGVGATPNLIIGGKQDGSEDVDTWVNGQINEVRLFGTAVLTDAELLLDYKSGYGIANDANLVGHWRFNDDLLDETANDLDLSGSGGIDYTVSYQISLKQYEDGINYHTGSITGWWHPFGNSGQQTLFTEELNADNCVKLYHEDNQLHFEYKKDGNMVTVSGMASIVEGSWYFFTAKWNENTGLAISWNYNTASGDSSDMFGPLTESATNFKLASDEPTYGGSVCLQIWNLWLPDSEAEAAAKDWPVRHSVEGLYNSGAGLAGPIVSEHILFEIVEG